MLGDVVAGMTATVVVESSDYQACTRARSGPGRQPDRRSSSAPTSSNGHDDGQQRRVPGRWSDRRAAGDGTGIDKRRVRDRQRRELHRSLRRARLPSSRSPEHPTAHNVSNACSGRASPSRAAAALHPRRRRLARAATLQTHDDRFLSAVWVNNVLWAAGNTGCTPSGDSTTRACLNVVHATASDRRCRHERKPAGARGSQWLVPVLPVARGGHHRQCDRHLR